MDRFETSPKLGIESADVSDCAANSFAAELQGLSKSELTNTQNLSKTSDQDRFVLAQVQITPQEQAQRADAERQKAQQVDQAEFQRLQEWQANRQKLHDAEMRRLQEQQNQQRDHRRQLEQQHQSNYRR